MSINPQYRGRMGYDPQSTSNTSFLDKYRTKTESSSTAPAVATESRSQGRVNYVSTPTTSNSYASDVDTAILRASGSVVRDERLGNEILARAGPSYHYQKPEYRTQEVIAPELGLDSLNVQTDNDPLRIVKPAEQNIQYKQQVNVRFLEPPPAPEPAPIIIRERQAPAPPPPPPVVIRQRPPTPPTPPPLIIRERPPTPPPQQLPQVIEKVLPPPPTPPRQVIVERLPRPPAKPRQVIYEKWLPYQETKERPVIVERAPTPEVIRPPKNVIIEYETPTAHHEQIVIDEGVFRADPALHNATSTIGEVRIVDKITDLPVSYSKYLNNRRPSSSRGSLQEYYSVPQPQFTQTEPVQSYRTSTLNYPGAYTTTYRASYSNPYNDRGRYGIGSAANRAQSASYSKYV